MGLLDGWEDKRAAGESYFAPPSAYSGMRDMFDGGGPGTSGERFEGGGFLSQAANNLGFHPIGYRQQDSAPSYSSSGGYSPGNYSGGGYAPAAPAIAPVSYTNVSPLDMLSAMAANRSQKQGDLFTRLNEIMTNGMMQDRGINASQPTVGPLRGLLYGPQLQGN